MRKIRSGDTVLVTSGRNKGQQGKVRLNMIERDRMSRTSNSFARAARSQPESVFVRAPTERTFVIARNAMP
jgi:hypothetical protein